MNKKRHLLKINVFYISKKCNNIRLLFRGVFCVLKRKHITPFLLRKNQK